ncbi:p53-like transcription factor [Teratosphaeria nubilosa]|uniref:p53-like transcription factor n=1 Tax=Teratosphaeria nubilosa TaxID=161662 RepID=A0A6G1LQZ2_9PEZI|nr:p53-like transcription factor [Teratosphaeria nubilosa]
MLPPPTRSDSATTPGLADREAYATNVTPFLARSQLPSAVHPGFGSYPDTPRSTFAGVPSPVFPHYASHMASTPGYGPSANESSGFPWPNLEVLMDMTCEGQQVTPEIVAKVEKGFFLSPVDNKWTCYRRNYFSVNCHFQLQPNINNGRMYIKRTNGNTQEQIQAMGMRLSAAVDGSGGKNIELVQHTPKRDAGPKTKIDVIKVAPTPSTGRGEHTVSPHGIYTVPMGTYHQTGHTPGPYLPLQNHGEGNGSSSSLPTSSMSSQYGGYSVAGSMSMPGHQTNHTFERVQFKSATANNGKRRASQQYFHLIVELFADVRKTENDNPTWVKVAQRVSEKIVVRGRSPSHYSNEGQNGQGSRGSASGGSGYSATAAGYMGANAGGFRSSTGMYGGSLGATGGYRNHYNPGSDGSESSPGSADEGATDTDRPVDAVMSDAERAGIQDYEGYQYYPAPIYEDVPQQILPPLAKVESTARYSTEPRQYAVKAEYADAVPGAQWQNGGCGRFEGVPSSRGYFPDFSTGYS